MNERVSSTIIRLPFSPLQTSSTALEFLQSLQSFLSTAFDRLEPRRHFYFLRDNIDTSTVPVVWIALFRNLHALLAAPRNDSTWQSQVMLIGANPSPQQPLIKIELSHIGNGTDAHCTMPDAPTMNSSHAFGEDGGCTFIYRDRHVVHCRCTRLGSFALVARSDNMRALRWKRNIPLALIIGSSVSATILALLLLLHLLLWKAVKSDRAFLLFNFCISVISSNLLVLASHTQVDSKITCPIVAVCLHLALLCSLCCPLADALQACIAIHSNDSGSSPPCRLFCLAWGSFVTLSNTRNKSALTFRPA
uniref:GAIN-B domain-containing protein n=1 Tax=Eptatretus burgeri TaxID=7764 RepID=A0A8C4R437_EPTBU